jgi:hypothetical protein
MFARMYKRQNASMPSPEEVQKALEWLRENGPIEFTLISCAFYFGSNMPREIEITLDRIYFCDQSLHPEGLVFEGETKGRLIAFGIVSYLPIEEL